MGGASYHATPGSAPLAVLAWRRRQRGGGYQNIARINAVSAASAAAWMR